MKKRQETLTSIRRGDQVVLGGGIVGKVTKVIDDNELEVEIAEGVKNPCCPRLYCRSACEGRSGQDGSRFLILPDNRMPDCEF